MHNSEIVGRGGSHLLLVIDVLGLRIGHLYKLRGVIIDLPVELGGEHLLVVRYVVVVV